MCGGGKDRVGRVEETQDNNSPEWGGVGARAEIGPGPISLNLDNRGGLTTLPQPQTKATSCQAGLCGA